MSDWPSGDANLCHTCGRRIRFTDPGWLISMECADCAEGRHPLDEPRTRRCLCGVELSNFRPGHTLCEPCEEQLQATEAKVLRGAADRWPAILKSTKTRLEERHGRSDPDAAA